MSIDEKCKQATAYMEAVKAVETLKPDNECYDIISNGVVGKVIYYPLENLVEVDINGVIKFNAEYAEPLYEALKKLLGKEE